MKQKKVYYIISLILTAISSYFIMLKYLEENRVLIAIVFFILIIIKSKLLVHYISIIKVFLTEKRKKIFYIFPFILINPKKFCFIDPMFLTRNSDYYIVRLTDSSIKKNNVFSVIFLIFNFVLFFVINHYFKWSIFLFLPIFNILFMTKLSEVDEKHIKLNNDVYDILDGKNNFDLPTKVCDEIEFNLLAILLIHAPFNKKLYDQDYDLNINNIDVETLVYKKRDLLLIKYWLSQFEELSCGNQIRMDLIDEFGIEFLPYIQSNKLIPKHIEYYYYLLKCIKTN